MEIQAIQQNGQSVIPSFSLPTEKKKIIGIQTNVQRKSLLMQQMLKQQHIFSLPAQSALYERLTPKEYIAFLKQVTNHSETVTQLLHTFQLQAIATKKIHTLNEWQKAYLSNIRIYFAHQSMIVMEDPFAHLDVKERQLFKEILEQLAQTKEIIVITTYLEDALISCDDVYRLDDTGFHLLDIVDEESELDIPTEEDEFKIQKIQTKKDDKTILFNPPEIDYIESMNGAIIVHVGGEAYQCALTLTELEKRLQHYGFYRCHRSYIVNLQKVREMITWTKNSYSLRLTTGKDSVVPLSRSKLSELKQLLNL